MSKRKPDVIVGGGGTAYSFTPLTKRAKAWVKENVQLEGWQWLGNPFAVEHRFARDLAAGMVNAGLEVQ